MEDLDNFSKLPTELVTMIVTFLPFLDAFRLCLVRKDWYQRNLWYRCSSLDLDETNFMYNAARQNFLSIGRKTRSQELKRRGKLGFVDFLNRTMPQLQTPVLSRLNFRMCFAAQYQEMIDNLIRFAIHKRVETLSLDFSDGDPLLSLDPPSQSILGLRDEPSYVLPSCFFEEAKAVKILSLTCCCLGVFHFKGFLMLTYLSLKRVDVSDAEVIHILQRCPLLETLALLDCRELQRLEICFPVLRLKRFIVKGCSSISLGIELFLPGLEYFEYAGKLLWFKLRQMTHLEEAVFEFPADTILPYNSQELKTFLSGLANVKILSFCTFALKVLPSEYMADPSCFQFELLEHMTVKTYVDPYEIPGILVFLQNSNLLKTLSISITIPLCTKFSLFGINGRDENVSDEIWQFASEKTFLYHLEEVDMYGFTGKEHEISLLKFILKTSKSLSKLTVTPSSSINRGIYWKAIEEIQHGKVASESITFIWL